MDAQMLVAVWVERFQKAVSPIMMREGSLVRLLNQSAVVRAASANRKFSMSLTTNALGPEALEKLERLYRHGFTVVEVPDYWVHENSRPPSWRDELTNLAMDRVVKLPDSPDLEQRAPYDEALAHEVLTIIERDYPHWVSIIDVKHAFRVEPNDNALITALEALSHETKIEGGEHSAPTRKLPINVEVRPTPLGRDEVKGTKGDIPYMSVIHGDQNINYGQAGAIGRQSIGTVNHQQQWATSASQFDLAQVATELRALKVELMKTAKTATDFQQLSLVAEAEQYAEKQDGPRVMEILSRSGKWLFDFATHVGIDITAKLIAKATGIES